MSINFLTCQSIDVLVRSYLTADNIMPAHQRREKQTIILNSILVTLHSSITPLLTVYQLCMYNLQVNCQDRQTLIRTARLLKQVITRSAHFVVQAEVQLIKDIIKLACGKVFVTVCGNEFIMLLNKLTSLLQIGKEKYEGVLKMVWEVLMDRRMHVGAYRQEIRGQLYAMLYRVLNLGKGVVKKLLDKCNEGEFVNNVITFVENEKDPRNMSLVFHIISIILNNYELGANKTVLFELLEAYYPIDFEGDEDQHVAIDKQELVLLLDNCLCHEVFRKEMGELLRTKIGGPPIGKFVKSVVKYVKNCRQLDSQHKPKEGILSQSLLNTKTLLLKLCDSEYLQQQYDDPSYDITDLMATLLQQFLKQCISKGLWTIQSYKTVVSWLDKLIVGQLLCNENNVRHSGVAVMIVRKVMIKQDGVLQQGKLLIVRYCLCKFLQHSNSPGQLLPKLGLLVLLFSLQLQIQIDSLFYLLVMNLGSIYCQSTSNRPQIQMVVSKVLMQLYSNHPELRTVIKKVGNGQVFKLCYKSLQDYLTNATIKRTVANTVLKEDHMIKCQMDYLSVVHCEEILHEVEIVVKSQYVSFENRVYYLIRLWESLAGEERFKANKVVLVAIGETFRKANNQHKIECVFDGVRRLQWKSMVQLLVNICWGYAEDDSIEKMKQEGQEKEGSHTTEVIVTNENILRYKLIVGLSRVVVNKLYVEEQLSSCTEILAQLMESLKQLKQCGNTLLVMLSFKPILKFFEDAHKDQLAEIVRNIMQLVSNSMLGMCHLAGQLLLEAFTCGHQALTTNLLLPKLSDITLQNLQSSILTLNPILLQFYPPTSLHKSWLILKQLYLTSHNKHYKTTLTLLVGHLSSSVLAADCQFAIELLLQDYEHVEIVAKIVTDLTIEDMFKYQMIGYCQRYLQKMEEKCGNEKEKGQYTVQKIVAVLLIVVQGFKKCEKNNDKYLQLKSHQKMLKWVNKLLSHHKRIVRQTARKLLAIYSRLD